MNARPDKRKISNLVPLATVIAVVVMANSALALDFACACLIWPLYEVEDDQWMYYAERYDSTTATPPGLGCASSTDVVYVTAGYTTAVPEYCDNAVAGECDCSAECDLLTRTCLANGDNEKALTRKVVLSGKFPADQVNNDTEVIRALSSDRDPAEVPAHRAHMSVVRRRVFNLRGHGDDIKVLAVQLLVRPPGNLVKPARLIWVALELGDGDHGLPTNDLAKAAGRIKDNEFELADAKTTSVFRARVRDTRTGAFQVLIFTTRQ
jgi:hypothetical protein